MEGLSPDYMEILNLDESELKSRFAFFEIGEEDVKRLISLQDFAEKYTHRITEALYELILGHPETRTFFPDEATIKHVKKMQNVYFRQLFCGKYDRNYVRNRLKVGAVHERIGMPPKWYLGAYRRYLHLILNALREEFKDHLDQVIPSFQSIKKIISFDQALAIDTYISAHVEAMTRQQAAIRELSTPVIKAYERILLLPIIGTVDTLRAQQIMETVLTHVVEEQAKVFIIDIAGVPVVDTKVADHILKTAAAVQLLGGQTIITGITALVARTIVHLGVEMSRMHTCSNLAEGIELALDITGKRIIAKSMSRPGPELPSSEAGA